MRYVIFTKSHWNDPPRLRHQYAAMLAKRGADVMFFEKPAFFFSKAARQQVSPKENIGVTRCAQLIHHQLRLNGLLRRFNASFETLNIRKTLARLEFNPDIILNFCYDYYFIREVIPDKKIVTIINDDYIAQARFKAGKHVLETLRLTCEMSDAVIVVSEYLKRQISDFSSAELLYPWSDSPYLKPHEALLRDTVIIWGYIGAQYDYNIIENVLRDRPQYNVCISGPILAPVKKTLRQLQKKYSNLSVLGECCLDALPLDKCFAAALPYRPDVAHHTAVSMSNKTLRLMSRGLPLVTYGVPNFYDHQAIFKVEQKELFTDFLDRCQIKFDILQGGIESLVNRNLEEHRYEQFRQVIEKIS